MSCRGGDGRLSVGDVDPVRLVQECGMHCRVGEQDGALALGRESQAHVSRKVTGRHERRDTRGELEPARDGLEAMRISVAATRSRAEGRPVALTEV